jgi:hypothetical protein
MKQTIIHLNGSKWPGEEPDIISKLVQVLKDNTLSSDFFGNSIENNLEEHRVFVTTPIFKIGGQYVFWGNFEERNHGFYIESNDPAVIKKLKSAIIHNPGWNKHRHLCKSVKN